MFYVQLFSWKTTFHKDHLEVCLPNSRLVHGLLGIWASMKITLVMGWLLYTRSSPSVIDDYLGF